LEKPGSHRTTITVPFGLKARMDAVSESVNWSAVAAAAFEAKLAEIAEKKLREVHMGNVDDVDLSAVADRLRMEKRLASGGRPTDDELHAKGRQYGRLWAAKDAPLKALVNIEQHWRKEPKTRDSLRLNHLLRGVEPKVVGEQWMREPPFEEGFLDGVMEIWGQVKRGL
jgi:hypothetical protein